MSTAPRSALARKLTEAGRRALAVPIHVKILGIGVFVAAIFGAAVMAVVGTHVQATLEESVEEQSVMLAGWLASRVERNLVTGDLLGLHDILNETWNRFPHIAYLIVEDRTGHTIGRTEELLAPPPPEPAPASLAGDGLARRNIKAGARQVFESTAPVLNGAAGRVRVGLDDRSVTAIVGSIERRLLLVLALCLFAGSGLALYLTYVLTRPIHILVQTARAVERGDLGARAAGFHGDEVGVLADAFNRMVESLGLQRAEIVRHNEERGRLLEQILHTQEEERARVAHALHDELGQSMVAMLLRVRGGCEDRVECVRHKGVMEEQIGEMIGKVRQMARNLRPSILDDYGLDTALKRLVSDNSSEQACSFDFRVVADEGATGRLSPEIEAVLYRVAQEAITNIVKHADAKHASVILYRHPDSATLLVEDDGRGFSPQGAAHAGGGLGLGHTGMAERVVPVGGEVVIESAPGRGTTLRATIPLRG